MGRLSRCKKCTHTCHTPRVYGFIKVDKNVYDRCYWPMLILFGKELYVERPPREGPWEVYYANWTMCEVMKWTVEDVRTCLELIGAEEIGRHIYIRESMKHYEDPQMIGLQWGCGNDDLMEMFGMVRYDSLHLYSIIVVCRQRDGEIYNVCKD